MFYAAFPPEINSGRIYSGPGSEPLMAAAAAWGGLANDLQSTAASYSSVISGLTAGPWLGPTALSMAAAVAPYLTWMQDTAAQAAETGSQATAAAIAYETAFAAHVPPAVIASNRSQLAALVSTNIIGQNNASIAATEAQYGEMWAQDAAAMETYAGSSAAASKLTPFTAAPLTTNSGGLAAQTAAATSTASPVLQWLANLATDYSSTITGLLNSLFGPSGASTFTALYSAVKVPLGLTTQFNDVGLLTNFPVSQFLKFTPAPSFGAVPKEGLGGGLTGPWWGRGLADQLSVGRHGKGRHGGRKAIRPAQLGQCHAGCPDGRCRLVGLWTRGGARGRDRRRQHVQFDARGRDARQCDRRRGSHRRGQQWSSQSAHPAQRPQEQAVARAIEAAGGANFGEAGKRAAPHGRPRRT